MPRVLLFCYSNREGCCGIPGDVIECSAKDAEYFVSSNAGVIVEAARSVVASEPIVESSSADVKDDSVGDSSSAVSQSGNPKRARR